VITMNMNDNYSLNTIKDTAVYVLDNFFRTAPESLLFGSAALAILLQNMAFFVLTIAILVFKLANVVIGKFVLEIFPDGPGLYYGEGMNEAQKCEFNYNAISQLQGLNSAMKESSIPSSTTFIFLATLFYCMRSVHAFSKEMDSLEVVNPAFKNILPISFVFTVLFILAYIVWRWKYQCSTPQQLFLTLAAAAGVGSLVSVAFEKIFGKYGINLLNMPFLEPDNIKVGSVASCTG
jgi:hypothetical protein